MPAMIGRAGQDLMDGLYLPQFPAYQSTFGVQMIGDCLDAHARAVDAVDVQFKNLTHHTGLGFLNGQFFLDASMSARLPCINGFVAKGCFGTIKISLTGIFLHPAQNVLGGFLALIFIKHHNNVALHFPSGVVLHLLGYRDKLNSGFQ
ncbi:MAG: hypothetical protein WCD70_10410 [Alphaproteobacteria bacterium]